MRSMATLVGIEASELAAPKIESNTHDRSDDTDMLGVGVRTRIRQR